MSYQTQRTGIAIVPGVEVDLTLRATDEGADAERRVDHVETDLLERLCRLAWAYDEEADPDELPDDLPDEFTPPMSVAWERVFSEENEEEANA